MRDYAKVSPKFWVGKTGKALRKQGAEALIVGLYLMTAPNANMLGLYYLPMCNIAHETGLGFEGASKGLQGAIEAGFCAYDEDTEMVWVYEMASYQVADRLKPDDKRCIGVQNGYNDLPENKHLGAFFKRYKTAFHMKNCRQIDSPFEVPCKPLRSQEQEQEQEKEQEQKQEKAKPSVELSLDLSPADPGPDPVQQIFAYWQQRMSSPTSRLDEKRRKLIEKALKLYTAHDIGKAIRGCSITPHNMGENDRNTKYNGLNLILRDAEHIDYFIGCNDGAPKKGGKESIEEMNARLEREFLQDGGDDANTIEMEA